MKQIVEMVNTRTKEVIVVRDVEQVKHELNHRDEIYVELYPKRGGRTHESFHPEWKVGSSVIQ